MSKILELILRQQLGKPMTITATTMLEALTVQALTIKSGWVLSATFVVSRNNCVGLKNNRRTLTEGKCSVQMTSSLR
jgi:hypothetical protein